MTGIHPSVRSAWRIVVLGLLLLLAIGHFFFALANLRYIERLPENLDVLIESIGASLAAGSLFWATAKHARRQRWATIVLLGSCAFAAGMTVSVATGASTPGMLQVVVPSLAVGAVALTLEGRSQVSPMRGARPFQ